MLIILSYMKGLKKADAKQANRIVVHANSKHVMTLERTDNPTLRVNGSAVPEYRVTGYDPSRLVEGGIEKIQNRVWVDADIPRPKGAYIQSWDLLGNLFDALKPLLKD